MDTPQQQFPVKTRVRLRDGIDPSLYNGFSRVGNEGWIRKRKRDKYGYPQVFIQWDKDHWAYNGQEDGWTWEGHFEAVEETPVAEAAQPTNSNAEEQVRAITENFVKSIFSVLGSEPQAASEEPEPATEEPEEDQEDKWAGLAAETSEAIAQAPAYLTIALDYVEHDGAPPMVIPRVFHASRTPEYALIVQSQLAHVLSSLQDQTIAGYLELTQQAKESTDESG